MRIQKIVVLFAVAMGILSCKPSNENTIQRNPENEALVKKYINAIVTGDTTAIEGLLAENFKDYGPNLTDSLDRAGAVADYKNNWRNDWASVEFDRYTMLSATLTEERIAGDWVLDWGRVTLHYKSKKPTISFNWHGAFKVKEGKIVEANSFFNQGDIMRQLGYTFVPPADSTAMAKSK